MATTCLVRSDAKFGRAGEQSTGGLTRSARVRERGMTRPIPFTKARLRRAIEAAREAGLRVTAIRPDGTLIIDDNPQTPQEPVEEEQKVVL
jgi:hypothetical protein